MSEFTHKTCSAPAERSQRMCDLVLKHVPRDHAIRMLDVGCGTGSLVFLLARALPAATLVGVDVSADVVEEASAFAAGAGVDNVRFLAGDFRTIGLEKSISKLGSV